MKYWLARAGEEKPEGPFSKADLSRMYHAGEVEMLDQVALHGTERWQDLGKLLGLRDYQDPAAVPPPLPQVQAHKKRTSGNGGVGCMMMIVGLVLLLIFWPLGLLLIFGAAILDQASVHYICTACGNQTVRTARHCMACKAVFVPESLARNLLKGLAVGLLCLGLIGWGVWSSMQAERTNPAAKPVQVQRVAPTSDPRAWESWNAMANVWRTAGADVEQSNDPRKMVVILPLQLARKLTDYELKTLAQAAWSRFPDAYSLRVRDELGTELVSASVFGVKVTR